MLLNTAAGRSMTWNRGTPSACSRYGKATNPGRRCASVAPSQVAVGLIRGCESNPPRSMQVCFAEWSDNASFPLLPSGDSVRILLKLGGIHGSTKTTAGWRAPIGSWMRPMDRRHFEVAPRFDSWSVARLQRRLIRYLETRYRRVLRLGRPAAHYRAFSKRSVLVRAQPSADSRARGSTTQTRCHVGSLASPFAMSHARPTRERYGRR